MALSVSDLIELTGAYTILNGDLITFQDGRHIVLGSNNAQGVFTMSDEGRAFLASLDGVEVDEVIPAPPIAADAPADVVPTHTVAVTDDADALAALLAK